VTDFRPLHGIACALERRTRSGQSCGDDERVTLAQAIRMYTINAAYAEFAEGWKGSLEPGKTADLVVLNADIARLSPTELRELPVDLTISAGRVVHER
jgi:predicted amidohydrolase YtcJ